MKKFIAKLEHSFLFGYENEPLLIKRKAWYTLHSYFIAIIAGISFAAITWFQENPLHSLFYSTLLAVLLFVAGLFFLRKGRLETIRIKLKF